MSITPWTGYEPIAWPPHALTSLVPNYTPRWSVKHCESKMSCPRTQPTKNLTGSEPVPLDTKSKALTTVSLRLQEVMCNGEEG